MIYRVLVESGERGVAKRDVDRVISPYDKAWGFGSPRRAYLTAILDDLKMPLPPPWVAEKHPEGRYWFTEQGWQRFGRHLLHDAQKRATQTKGVMRLLQRRDPRPDEIIWQDEWQVVLRPSKPYVRSKRVDSDAGDE